VRNKELGVEKSEWRLEKRGETDNLFTLLLHEMDQNNLYLQRHFRRSVLHVHAQLSRSVEPFTIASTGHDQAIWRRPKD
jgi:hypothetical protein